MEFDGVEWFFDANPQTVDHSAKLASDIPDHQGVVTAFDHENDCVRDYRVWNQETSARFRCGVIVRPAAVFA